MSEDQKPWTQEVRDVTCMINAACAAIDRGMREVEVSFSKGGMNAVTITVKVKR